MSKEEKDNKRRESQQKETQRGCKGTRGGGEERGKRQETPGKIQGKETDGGSRGEERRGEEGEKARKQR